MEMENQFTSYQVFREMVNETMTPDEERAVMTWITSRSPEEMQLRVDCAPAMRALRLAVRDLQQNGVDPTSQEAQALAVRENDLCVRYKMRELPAAMFEWNTSLAEKWLQMGERAAWRSAESLAPDADLLAYFYAIRAASPWHSVLAQIVDEAAKLAGKKVRPSDQAALALVERLRNICAEYSLGDPLVYVRCARTMQFRWPAEDVARKRTGWTFLSDAIEVAKQ
jgi:hypothetical protein